MLLPEYLTIPYPVPETQDEAQEEVISLPEIIVPKKEESTEQQPEGEKTNFRITDDNLGVGSDREKCRNNIEAIRTLRQIEQENRLAAPEEQEILSKLMKTIPPGRMSIGNCRDF